MHFDTYNLKDYVLFPEIILQCIFVIFDTHFPPLNEMKNETRTFDVLSQTFHYFSRRMNGLRNENFCREIFFIQIIYTCINKLTLHLGILVTGCNISDLSLILYVLRIPVLNE